MCQFLDQFQQKMNRQNTFIAVMNQTYVFNYSVHTSPIHKFDLKTATNPVIVNKKNGEAINSFPLVDDIEDDADPCHF